jgi:hypothetical protein
LFYKKSHEALLAYPKFSVRKGGSELLIGHFGSLLNVVKWSADNVELIFLDTFSASNFQMVSSTDDLVLLVSPT